MDIYNTTYYNTADLLTIVTAAWQTVKEINPRWHTKVVNKAWFGYCEYHTCFMSALESDKGAAMISMPRRNSVAAGFMDAIADAVEGDTWADRAWVANFYHDCVFRFDGRIRHESFFVWNNDKVEHDILTQRANIILPNPVLRVEKKANPNEVKLARLFKQSHQLQYLEQDISKCELKVRDRLSALERSQRLLDKARARRNKHAALMTRTAKG